jgi:anti-sigma regulatory factor (Ser/Thr protein kinase)
MNLEPVTSFLHIILDNDCNINCTITFARTIPSSSESIRHLIDDAMEYLLLIKCNGRAAHVEEFNFRLALDESLENALRHGNKYDAGKSIAVMIEADDHKAFITVCDEGNGFRIEDVPSPVHEEHTLKPNGRGLHLLKNLFLVEWMDNGRCIKIVV